MIVQCEACQTRFRLADEKIKTGGTKVRCSKCKEVFTVMPPEPEPVEETIDYGSFNMEKIADEPPTEAAVPPQEAAQKKPAEETEEQLAASEPSADDDLDFSSLESEMGNSVPNNELADDFSFVDTSKLESSEDEEEAVEDTFPAEAEPQGESDIDESTDFDEAFSETDEPGGALEFEFNEESAAAEPETSDEANASAEETTGVDEFDFSTEDADDSSAFSLDESPVESQEQESSDEFAFGDDSGDDAFAFADTEEESPAAASNEASEPDEFSFDDESPFADDSSSEWEDSSTGDAVSFDFEEPHFDNSDAPAKSPTAQTGDDGLQFGEIDFASDGADGGTPSFSSDDDFSKAALEQKEAPAESFSPRQESPKAPADDYDDEEPLPAPPPAKKSSLSRILVLLILLLVILGGAAGFLFVQEGTVNLNTIGQYLPFLQNYIGETPVSAPGDRIGINVSGSSYVNGQAGQMLVIQGAAINNHPKTRSAITIKGVLIDDQGKTLLQQTVFCGNQLNEAELKTLSFAAIEEAMNNQFGDGLSNMNVAAGASIPFTIVFRNLPDGIANINVEVVESKPGAG